MKSRRPCDRWRLKSLSLVLSLLFNPALSQTSWFEPKRLSTVPFGSTHFQGSNGAAGNRSYCRQLFTASETGQSLRTAPSLARKTTLGPHASLRGLVFDALRSLWWSWPCRRGEVVGIIQIGDARGMGILFGRACDHQRVVAFDLQPAAVEHRVVAEVGIEANVATGRRVLVAHRFVRGVPHQLVQAGDWDQLIPIHPANTPDTLVTRPADTPAQQEVLLAPVQAGPGVGAGPVDELPVLARLRALQHKRMNSGVAHQLWPLVRLQPGV